MDRYSYFSEKAALEQGLLEMLQANRDQIIKSYLEIGFNEMAAKLSLKAEWQAQVAFDYVVFECKGVQEVIKANRDFFMQIISEGEGGKIRNMLGIDDVKYDSVWLDALELMNKLFTQKVIKDKLFNLACTSFFFSSRMKHKKIASTDED